METTNPTVIYLIRHADVHNPQDIVYGRMPRFGLSQTGFHEAETTARYLASSAQLSAIYSSPMLRARQTADIISWSQDPPTAVMMSEALNEVRTGWQGYPNRDLMAGKFNFYDPKKDPSDESIMDVYNRVYGLVRIILERHAGQSIVCVTHGDPVMILKTGLREVELRRDTIREPDYPAKASVTTFIFNTPETAPQISYFDPNAELHQRIEAEEKARQQAAGQTPSQPPLSEAPASASEEHDALAVTG
ncbi:MAG: hypothetical protein DLM69_04425 [Candidatus Chloroheliales bacterium]|nr:MAG: hypothetical protein DLM69_04425 [Chloroflexota bacterium]